MGDVVAGQLARGGVNADLAGDKDAAIGVNGLAVGRVDSRQGLRLDHFSFHVSPPFWYIG